MSFNSTNSLTLVAGGALAAKTFVSFNASGNAVTATADLDAIGVVNSPSENGNAVEVTVYNGGVAEVVASAAIASGDPIAVAANGQAKTASTSNTVVGYAKTSAANAGEVIEVMLVKAGNTLA